MRVEPATAIIGIDIEGMLCQAGDRRAHEPAAEGKDQPVIRQCWSAAGADDPPAREVDVSHLRFDALDADWSQNLIERNPRFVEIGLVVAHADRMPRTAVGQADLDPLGADADLVELAGGADRGP
jgi:hypothetical protein